MTTPVDVFPNAEAAAGKILRTALTSSGVYSSIPKNPTYPLIIVRRTGGAPVTRMRLDAADLQFDVYGTTQTEARTLAAQARQALYAAEATTVTLASGDAWISGVRDITGLFWAPDSANVPINRYIFNVRVFLHAA